MLLIVPRGACLVKKSWFVVVEGIDQSGKNTQSEILLRRFEDEGYRANLLSFPNYKTRIGKLIKSFLSGKISYPPEVRHMLLSANRWETKSELENHLKKGFALVCNRYSQSNIPYGVANGLDRKWLEALDDGLPKPDAVILIDISPKMSLARKGKERDLHEKDLNFLNKVRENYLRLAEEQNWITVDGERNVEKVSRDIWNLVSKRLNIN